MEASSTPRDVANKPDTSAQTEPSDRSLTLPGSRENKSSTRPRSFVAMVPLDAWSQENPPLRNATHAHPPAYSAQSTSSHSTGTAAKEAGGLSTHAGAGAQAGQTEPPELTRRITTVGPPPPPLENKPRRGQSFGSVSPGTQAPPQQPHFQMTLSTQHSKTELSEEAKSDAIVSPRVQPTMILEAPNDPELPNAFALSSGPPNSHGVDVISSAFDGKVAEGSKEAADVPHNLSIAMSSVPAIVASASSAHATASPRMRESGRHRSATRTQAPITTSDIHEQNSGGITMPDTSAFDASTISSITNTFDIYGTIPRQGGSKDVSTRGKSVMAFIKKAVNSAVHGSGSRRDDGHDATDDAAGNEPNEDSGLVAPSDDHHPNLSPSASGAIAESFERHDQSKKLKSIFSIVGAAVQAGARDTPKQLTISGPIFLNGSQILSQAGGGTNANTGANQNNSNGDGSSTSFSSKRVSMLGGSTQSSPDTVAFPKSTNESHIQGASNTVPWVGSGSGGPPPPTPSSSATSHAHPGVGAPTGAMLAMAAFAATAAAQQQQQASSKPQEIVNKRLSMQEAQIASHRRARHASLASGTNHFSLTNNLSHDAASPISFVGESNTSVSGSPKVTPARPSLDTIQAATPTPATNVHIQPLNQNRRNRSSTITASAHGQAGFFAQIPPPPPVMTPGGTLSSTPTGTSPTQPPTIVAVTSLTNHGTPIAISTAFVTGNLAASPLHVDIASTQNASPSPVRVERIQRRISSKTDPLVRRVMALEETVRLLQDQVEHLMRTQGITNPATNTSSATVSPLVSDLPTEDPIANAFGVSSLNEDPVGEEMSRADA